jgi:hypothetical protein
LVVRAERDLVRESAPDDRHVLARGCLQVWPFLRDVGGDDPGALAPCAGSLVPAIGYVNIGHINLLRLRVGGIAPPAPVTITIRQS